MYFKLDISPNWLYHCLCWLYCSTPAAYIWQFNTSLGFSICG
uniref:Uncharacterized protein n=1 Tax=Arundo donax TaxID=35708 RepID=A0A0A9GQU0_ARUDO